MNKIFSFYNSRDSIQELKKREDSLPKILENTFQDNPVPHPTSKASFRKFQAENFQTIQTRMEAIKAYEDGKRYMSEKNKKAFLKAIDSFTQAIGLDPTDSRFWADRALCYCLIDDHREAIPDYLEAYKLSGNLDYLVDRAKILLDYGRKDEAVADLEFAASKGSKYAKDTLHEVAKGWRRVDRDDW